MKDPTPQQKLSALEIELEGHKQRFLAASQQGVQALKQDLSPLTWIAAYPVQTAMLAFAGGLLFGMLGDSRAAGKPLGS